MLGTLSHIAVVVRDLDAAIHRFTSLLGGRLLEREQLSATGTDVAVVELGGAHIELLSSRLPDSKVGRILAERGECIHHLSFDVDCILDQLAQLQKDGVRVLDQTPRTGVHGRRIAFIHPEETSGILFEMVEEPPTHPSEKK